MNDHLPPSRINDRIDAFAIMTLWPLERVTKALRMGDGCDLSLIRPLAHRCRALADAYDARMRAADMPQEVTTDGKD